ncbi:variant erythrocyte surface antigen-1 family protein [Babesia caballi]|uniref:Variant erythrocyte surface antigen-1 family protein n=1 Tax=Babesia caballi TaxID=5871 RepID=A0AAV4LZ46_BABCB|nr:variant erythrocyte surface antigen-1 family protein [Babesia caballi]
MSSPGKQLTDCPSNLKEAIDWILRVTGKDGGGGDGGTAGLINAVQDLLRTAGVEEINSKIAITQSLITNLAEGLATFIGYGENGQVGQIGDKGIAVGQGYKKSYDGTWKDVFLDVPGISSGYSGDKIPPVFGAKIFLGCLPMIFSALSYLYWRCSQEGNGEWRDFSLNGQQGSNSNKFSLKIFMTSVGFGSKILNGSKLGSQIFTSAQNNFEDFTDCMSTVKGAAQSRHDKESKVMTELGLTHSGVSASSNPTYPEFLKTLNEEAYKNIKQNISPKTSTHPLSTLFQISRLYFTAKQTAISKLPDFKPKSPSTIREMLYFLAALPFSPSYASLSEHISSIFKTLSPKSSNDDVELLLPVADSGSQNKGDYLSPDKMRDYLTNTSFFSCVILGRIQGHSADSQKHGEPWLHSLFSNSQFNLSIPSSGAGIFGALSNYAYALQFQLSFLQQQCISSINNCGWRACQFGTNIHPNGLDGSGNSIPSHVCPVFRDCRTSGCSHDGKVNKQGSGLGCKHHYVTQPTCGSAATASPLQAFLTDNLKGFSLSQTPDTSSLNHLDNHPPAPCAMSKWVSHIKRSVRNPNKSHKYVIDPSSVIKTIYKMIEKLSYTPQSLSPSGLENSLLVLTKNLPFWFQLFMVDGSKELPGTLFDLRQHCHNPKQNDASKHYDPSGQSCAHTANNPADMWSLYCPVGPANVGVSTDPSKACRSGKCGGYLSPLTQSTGATYAPSNACTYFSWVLFLADDMYTGFQNLLQEFRNIDCKRSGCKTKSSGACKCNPGEHGALGGNQCACTSVVQCGGVLPLLYCHGFQFYSAYSLNGGNVGSENSRRSCTDFNSALSNVLADGAPLHNLLLAIDEFLYYVRFRFMSMVSSFWLCSLAILLYFIFYGIDVLHLQSHVHLPSSHTVPPIGLLSTGKAPALAKLTYYIP